MGFLRGPYGETYASTAEPVPEGTPITPLSEEEQQNLVLTAVDDTSAQLAQEKLNSN